MTLTNAGAPNDTLIVLAAWSALVVPLIVPSSVLLDTLQGRRLLLKHHQPRPVRRCPLHACTRW